MNPIAAILILAGTSLSMVAALGLVRLPTAYARVHAAGKASPISFLLIAAGCGIELGLAASAQLAVAAVALVATLPVATHLLFRAIYRTTPSEHLHADALRDARATAVRDDVTADTDPGNRPTTQPTTQPTNQPTSQPTGQKETP